MLIIYNCFRKLDKQVEIDEQHTSIVPEMVCATRTLHVCNLNVTIIFTFIIIIIKTTINC